MIKRGGKRQGAGRKPLAVSQKKKRKTIWLTPAEEAICLQFGDTVQEGIKHIVEKGKPMTRALIAEIIKRDLGEDYRILGDLLPAIRVELPGVGQKIAVIEGGKIIGDWFVSLKTMKKIKVRVPKDSTFQNQLLQEGFQWSEGCYEQVCSENEAQKLVQWLDILRDVTEVQDA